MKTFILFFAITLGLLAEVPYGKDTPLPGGGSFWVSPHDLTRFRDMGLPVYIPSGYLPGLVVWIKPSNLGAKFILGELTIRHADNSTELIRSYSPVLGNGYHTPIIFPRTGRVVVEDAKFSYVDSIPPQETPNA